MSIAPVTVGIPTFGRGLRVAATLERIYACDPQPAEVIVHVDQSDGGLESELKARFPPVRTLSSEGRVGPGGGRHRCIMAASYPVFVSFDDDSWPVDSDYFGEMASLFTLHPEAAVFAASIFHPHEREPIRTAETRPIADFTGCGYGIRIAAYRQTTGHIDRACGYAIEEVDIAIQLYALDWKSLHSSTLRVFHDTCLSHHAKPEIVTSTVQNVALRAFLRYPASLWGRGVLQVGNVIFDSMKRRRFAGLATGLCGIPGTLARYSSYRRVLSAAKVRSYLDARANSTL